MHKLGLNSYSFTRRVRDDTSTATKENGILDKVDHDY